LFPFRFSTHTHAHFRWCSTLSGFVGIGETLEDALVREVAEEVGVIVDTEKTIYLGSQPWPFPKSLMLAFETEVKGDTTINVDEDEIEDARWFEKDELREIARQMDSRGNIGGTTAASSSDGTLFLPGA
jgi:NAD+ diphosphatase